VEVGRLDLAGLDLALAAQPVDPDLELLVGDHAALARDAGALPERHRGRVLAAAALSDDLLEPGDDLLAWAALGPVDGPGERLDELPGGRGVAGDEVLSQHDGAGGERSEQADVGEQWPQAAALQRLVPQDAAEGADVELPLAQRLLGVDRRDHDQLDLLDLVRGEPFALEVLLNDGL